jgi:hypothetical protein
VLDAFDEFEKDDRRQEDLAGSVHESADRERFFSFRLQEQGR